MTIARLVIGRNERALVWTNGSLAGIFGPGVRWIVAPFAAAAVHLYDVTVPEFEHPCIDLLLSEARSTLEQYFDIVELGAREVGVVYKNGNVAGMLAAGQRQLYWKGPVDVRVAKVVISHE
jgi:hypothetical protein